MSAIANATLPKPQRTQLEITVKAARNVAEKRASAALAQLAVADGKAPDYLTELQRVLRRKLRSHARALGDVSSQNSTIGVQHLVWEVAYELYLRGQVAWGKQGVATRQMRHLPACLYLRSPFDTNTAVIFPNDQASLAEIWCFCSSPDFLESVRRVEKLLAQADNAGKSLSVWLRDNFFEQHAKRFHHRPFIWHVWDGQKDGFGALVNYHKLDAKNLERLIHTYLGAWIGKQEEGVRAQVDGAQTRLAAAQDLKRRLEIILEGEPPYDIFVRWKKLPEQPIGWHSDLNDGVRLNIRPFITAEVLRHDKKPKLNITWDKVRGKDVASAPWFKVFGGDRINDHHLTRAQKEVAQTQTEGR